MAFLNQPMDFGGAPNMGPQVQMPAQPPKKVGMFGSGVGIGEALIAALNGYLMARGNPAGAMGMQMIHQGRQKALDEAQEARRREDEFQDFIRKEAYKSAHQGPDDLTIQMQQAGIDPNSEQGRAMRLQALQNKINPFVAITQQNADGSEQRQFIRPPMMGMGQPQIGSVVDDPRQGGPMPSASGGFPRPY